MKSLSLLIVFLVMPATLFADNGFQETVYSSKLKALRRAVSNTQLKQIKKDWDEWEVYSKKCDLELQLKRIPISCYRKLKIEAHLKLITKYKKQQAIDILEDICLAQIRTQNKGQISVDGNIEDLSESLECRNQILESEKWRKYRLIETEPRRVFMSYYK